MRSRYLYDRYVRSKLREQLRERAAIEQGPVRMSAETS